MTRWTVRSARNALPVVAEPRPRALIAVLAASSLVAALVLGLQHPAHAETPVSTSTGRFLGGSLLGSDLDALAEVEHAMTANTGGPTDVQNHPLAVDLLSALNVPLGDGLNLLGSNPLLSLGAVTQYSSSSPDGSSEAASGAVTNSGAIAVGGSADYPANMTLKLSGLIGSGLASTLGDVSLTTGALSGFAQQTADGTQSGQYQIAGLKLTVTSPLVAALVGQIQTLLASLQPVVDGITGLIGKINLGGLASVSTPPTLTSLLGSLGDVTTADGAITASLTTGTVSIDVGALLTSLGLDLSNLPANTSLLPYVLDALTHELLPALQGILTGPDGLISKIGDAINGIKVTVLGAPIVAPAVTNVLTTVVNDVSTPLNSLVSSLGDTIVTPVSNGLSALVGLTANVQEKGTDGSFTEQALRVDLLPGASSFLPASLPTATRTGAGAAVVNLAAAKVGPNAGPAAVPTATSLTPDHGPTTGGTTVTVTGTGFVAGKTTVTIGGVTVPASSVTVTSSTSLSFPTPAHEAGKVGVTVTTAGGTSGSLPYTYVDSGAKAPTVSSITPKQGPTTGGTSVTIHGSGFVPGSTSVTIGGTTVPASKVTVTSATSLTFSTPAHAAGRVDVSVTTAGGTSGSLHFTYVPPSGTKPVITSPVDGTTISDPTPVITGTAGPGSTVTVVVTGGSGCTATTTADGTWSCTASPALSDGAHVVTASSDGRDSDAVHFTLRTLAATSGPTTPANSGTASTGFAALGFLALGMLLAVAGAALTVMNRREYATA